MLLPPHISGVPHTALSSSCLKLLSNPASLQDHEGAIRVGISSLGIGGGNAHLLLEEYLLPEEPMLQYQ